MKLAVLATVALQSACTAAGASRPAPSLPGSDGALHATVPVPPERYLALVFFSHHCHCLAVHDPRLVSLAHAFRDRGVRFVGVDSENSANAERDRAEATRRGYPFPILIDQGGRLARALGAEYAGYVVVLDGEGNPQYRGGIDSDRVHLTSDRVPYLNDALEALIMGQKPGRPETESLGCALQIW